MRIYLDVCCINRPLDDLSIGRNRLEAEAVLEIIRQFEAGKWDLVGGDAVDAELALMPSLDRRATAMALANLRSISIPAAQAERSRAVELVGLGFRYMDALHISSAEAAGCEVLLTTDDALLSRSKRYKDRIMVKVANPLNWIAEAGQP